MTACPTWSNFERRTANGALDSSPALASSSIRNNARLRRGPIRLSGAVRPSKGTARVIVKLTRGTGGSCRAYRPSKGAFTGRPCSRNKNFAAAYANGKWSVHLRNRLRRGSYRLDVVAYSAEDRAQPIVAAKNRIAFRVLG